MGSPSCAVLFSPRVLKASRTPLLTHCFFRRHGVTFRWWRTAQPGHCVAAQPQLKRVCLPPIPRARRNILSNQLSGTLPRSIGSLTAAKELCAVVPSGSAPACCIRRRTNFVAGKVVLVCFLLAHCTVPFRCIRVAAHQWGPDVARRIIWEALWGSLPSSIGSMTLLANTRLCVVVLIASVSAHCTCHRTWSHRSDSGVVSAGALHCLLAAWLPSHRSLAIVLAQESDLPAVGLASLLARVADEDNHLVSGFPVRQCVELRHGRRPRYRRDGVSFLQVHYSNVSLARGCPVSTDACASNRARAGHGAAKSCPASCLARW